MGFNTTRTTLLLASEVQSPRSGVSSLRGDMCVSRGRTQSPGRSWKATSRGNVKRSTSTAVVEQEPGCAEQLSRFFPHTRAVRIPVQVTVLRASGPKLKEATVLEFAGPQEAIFLCTLPLEFEDRVRLERDAERCLADATVVAVQYHEGRKAVAVKFQQPPCNWVTRP